MKRLVVLVVIIFVLLAAGIAFTRNPKRTADVTPAPAADTNDLQSVQKNCSGIPLTSLTEGPYYKTGSPRRQKISESGTPGTHLILKGYVLDTDCQPIANAWLDFWQTDGEGVYDNSGYNLRGHQYTDEKGFFRLETVVPANYGNRTKHIHFKVRKTESSPVITSQLFFPDGENTSDSLFDESLVVKFGTDPDGSTYASYTVILP